MEGCRDAGRAILTQRVVYEAHARERDRVCWAADVVDEDDATRWCEVTDRAAGQTAKLLYHLQPCFTCECDSPFDPVYLGLDPWK
jgi:hypothetical protein